MNYKDVHRDLHKDVHYDVGDWKSATILTMPGFPKQIGWEAKDLQVKNEW